ncbi:SpoIIIAC/SpoIIIAD family protein [Ammoniphilus resinae]|uniref:Transmembrane protein n=1 Tax=Ammoniphilus resinae TaxID=861532 RepID=A0ABS4GXP9_9BACL|nr:hypothetical protein [Ammoniphilus resinae]
MEYQVLGKLSELATLSKQFPSLVSLEVIVHQSSYFWGWVEKNKKMINRLGRVVPLVTYAMFKPTFAFAATAAGGLGFFAGHGVILLHMLIVGFLTLLVTTFLKFTGRGDLAPLVVFVGGGIILYEVIGLFNAIYKAIATFLQV